MCRVNLAQPLILNPLIHSLHAWHYFKMSWPSIMVHGLYPHGLKPDSKHRSNLQACPCLRRVGLYYVAERIWRFDYKILGLFDGTLEKLTSYDASTLSAGWHQIGQQFSWANIVSLLMALLLGKFQIMLSLRFRLLVILLVGMVNSRLS